MTPFRRLLLVLLALVLSGAPACGSDDDGTGGSSGSGGSAGSGASGGSGGSGGSSASGGAGGVGGSAGATGGSAGATGGTAGAAGSGGQSSAYPPGPYGKEVGEVVANYAFEGYVNDTGDALSTTKPYVDGWTMDDLRKSGKSYALVHVSEFF